MKVVGAGGFEPPTAWFVARYSIQLSYAPNLYFTRLPLKEMVEKEGFEPSIELQTLYSLSRGAPSATRTPLRLVGRIIKISENMSNTFMPKMTIWLQNAHKSALIV